VIEDFLLSVIAHVNTPALFAVTKIGSLDATEKAISVRIVPSGRGERYLVGGTNKVNFQFLTKSKNQLQAISGLEQIADKLSDVRNEGIPSLTGKFTLISCDIYTTLNMVEKTATNEYIYTALFSAELEGGN
jgi:hypothetical protein